MQVHVFLNILVYTVGNRASLFVAFDLNSSDSDVHKFPMNVTGSLTETDKGMEICVTIVDIKPAVTQLVSWQFKP